MKKKISLSEAKTFAEKICNLIPCEHVICGSIRRKAPLVGDIDIAVEDLESVDKEFSKYHGYIRLTHINKKFDAEINGIQFNFYKEIHGAMILFLTGNYQLNVYMRIKAKQKSLKLNQYGLWDNGILLSKDEKEIFTLLDMDYLEPMDRSLNEYGFGGENSKVFTTGRGDSETL